MKEGRELIKEAVKDAKSLKDAALEAARNEIIEGMAPKLRSMLDEAVRGAVNEKRGLTGRNTQSQRGDYLSPKAQKWEEGKDKGEAMPMDNEKDEKELDLESLAGFFPQMSLGEEVEEEEETTDESMISTLGENDDSDDDDDEKDENGDEEVAENIEISEAELRKVYEAALQTEVQVKKGFSDMTKSGELSDVVKDVGKGLNPEKKGESSWEKVEPPAKEDYSVKEMFVRGMNENKMLREKLSQAVGLVKMLGGKLHEVNLFNAKVLHVNRILNQGARLTKEQKVVVMESIDKATSVSEVKMVYEAIVGSFKASQSLTENRRKPVANSQRARSTGTPKQKVLSESVDRASDNGVYHRLRELAGLVK